MRNKKYLFFLSILLYISIISCSNNSGVLDFKIISPKSDWRYFENQKIIFSSNLNDTQQKWISSLDGDLGDGAQIENELSSGVHIITLEYLPTGEKRSVKIIVNKKNNSKTFSLEYITKLPLEINYKAEEVGFFTLSGSSENLLIKTNKSETESFTNSEGVLPLCDNIQKPFSNTKLLEKIKPVSARSIIQECDERHFFVLNTMDSYSPPTEFNGKRYYSSASGLEVWLPEEILLGDYDKTRLIIDECIESIESIIIPRVNQLWGNCADINNDGKIAIFFSPSINSEGKALGFFYPSDFFERNTDKKSSAYNPYSNELDVIYAALPEEEGNYSSSAIIATIAHELTHAVNFSNNNFVQLETFLDEGLSHLTESLCGYGVSGGNVKFVDYYLGNSAYFSYCTSDYLGNSDSAGQRGAMLLFLYWLFEKYGGIVQNPQTPIEFIDTGGITFLRKIITSESNGWAAIGEAIGKNTDFLFREFSQELLTKKTEKIFDFNKKDLISGEPIFYCKELLSYSVNKKYQFLPYSLFFIENQEKNKSESITISATKYEPFFLLIQ